MTAFGFRIAKDGDATMLAALHLADCVRTQRGTRTHGVREMTHEQRRDYGHHFPVNSLDLFSSVGLVCPDTAAILFDTVVQDQRQVLHMARDNGCDILIATTGENAVGAVHWSRKEGVVTTLYCADETAMDKVMAVWPLCAKKFRL